MAFTARESIESRSCAGAAHIAPCEESDSLETVSVQPTDAPPRHGRFGADGNGSTAQTPGAAPMPATVAGRTFLHLQAQAPEAP